MAADKTPLSDASSDSEIGEYWDQHDLADHWDQTREVEMTIDPRKRLQDFVPGPQPENPTVDPAVIVIEEREHERSK